MIGIVRVRFLYFCLHLEGASSPSSFMVWLYWHLEGWLYWHLLIHDGVTNNAVWCPRMPSCAGAANLTSLSPIIQDVSNTTVINSDLRGIVHGYCFLFFINLISWSTVSSLYDVIIQIWTPSHQVTRLLLHRLRPLLWCFWSSPAATHACPHICDHVRGGSFCCIFNTTVIASVISSTTTLAQAWLAWPTSFFEFYAFAAFFEHAASTPTSFGIMCAPWSLSTPISIHWRWLHHAWVPLHLDISFSIASTSALTVYDTTATTVGEWCAQNGPKI